jgi:hypothetical protein
VPAGTEWFCTIAAILGFLAVIDTVSTSTGGIFANAAFGRRRPVGHGDQHRDAAQQRRKPGLWPPKCINRAALTLRVVTGPCRQSDVPTQA